MNRGFRALSSVRIAALPPDGQAAVTIQPRGANVKLVGISEAVETGTGSRRTAVVWSKRGVDSVCECL